MDKSAEKRMKVLGKRWEGIVEKEFTFVMFGDAKFTKDDEGEYFFRLAGQGISAKVPPAVFEGKNIIPNDANEILKAIVKFYS